MYLTTYTGKLQKMEGGSYHWHALIGSQEGLGWKEPTRIMESNS